MYIFLFFIFGLLMGSFFNVVGIRVPQQQSIVQPASHCTSCQKSLKPIDLIPVLSYLFNQGKCRYCNEKVSILYPLIELGTGILFAYSFYLYTWTPMLFGSLMLISLLIIIFVSDLCFMLIPDKILLFFIPWLIVYRILNPIDHWWDAWFGAVLGFLLLFIIAVISKGGMGGGDIKLFAVLGLMFGWQGTLLVLFLASLFGSIVGIILLALRKVKRKQHIPFGPYIVSASIVTLFWGEPILHWYFS